MAGWSKRKAIVLTGGASGAQTAFQLKLTVTYDGDMQSDFDDLRFTQADGTTLIDAWLETKTDDTSATVWAEFPTTPANTVEQTYYMYYGNVGAASDWDGSATFPFFDDFSGNLDKWDKTGTPAIVSGKAEMDADDGIISKTKYGYGYAFEGYSEANEQDINLIAAYETTANQNNLLIFSNSDSPHADVFDEFKIYLIEGGTSTSDYVTSWDDFRNTLRRYSIYRPAADDVTFVQGAHSVRYTTGNIPTVDLGLVFNVWDSSQASTLKVDWGFVRKYVANPPTYAFGAEESAPTGAAPTSVFIGPFGGPFGGPIQ